MKKVLVRAFIFLLPLLALAAFPLFILIVSGELTPVKTIVENHADGGRPFLDGLAYSNATPYLKLASTIKRRPDVLALGSSRVLLFRSSLFKSSFYNAGGAVNTAANFKLFLDRIPKGREPQMILVAMDPNYFNKNWNYLYAQVDVFAKPSSMDGLQIFATWWHRVYKDYWRGKIDLQKVIKHDDETVEKIGMNAIMKGLAFRDDGSMQYNRYIQWYETTDEPENTDRFKEDLSMMAEGFSWFTYGDKLSDQNLEHFAAFLEACRARNIHVVAFIPPYAPLVYNKILDYGEKYAYVPLVAPALKKIADRFGFSFFDFMDPSIFGLPNKEYRDAQHGSERIYAIMCAEMAKKDPILKSFMADDALSNELGLR